MSTTETRYYETIRETRRANGKSSAELRCPFCGVVTEVRLWSLAGSGKRCECGAVHSGRPGTAIAVSTKSTKGPGA